jgi:hypothetical protein
MIDKFCFNSCPRYAHSRAGCAHSHTVIQSQSLHTVTVITVTQSLHTVKQSQSRSAYSHCIKSHSHTVTQSLHTVKQSHSNTVSACSHTYSHCIQSHSLRMQSHSLHTVTQRGCLQSLHTVTQSHRRVTRILHTAVQGDVKSTQLHALTGSGHVDVAWGGAGQGLTNYKSY